jgi:hypothetical protein
LFNAHAHAPQSFNAGFPKRIFFFDVLKFNQGHKTDFIIALFRGRSRCYKCYSLAGYNNVVSKPMLIYLDYNCFQRSFDDLSDNRIALEALACQEIFSGAEQERWTLVWSFMHEDETSLCPFPMRKFAALKLAELCKKLIGPTEGIRQTALEYQRHASLSAKDAVHAACATHVSAKCFVSCDDQLVRQINRLPEAIKAFNPVEFVRKEQL